MNFYKKLSFNKSVILYTLRITYKFKFYFIGSILFIIINFIYNFYQSNTFNNFTNLIYNKDSTLEQFFDKGYYLLIYMATSTILYSFESYFISLLNFNIIKYIRYKFYKSIIYKKIDFFDENKSNSLFSLLDNDIQYFKSLTFINIITFLRAIFWFFHDIYMMYFNYKKLLFLFLSIFPILFYFFSLSNNKRRIFLDSLYNQKIEFNNKAFDILENIRIVKYFSTEEEEINNYNKILNDMYINQKNTIKKFNILDLLTNLSFFFGLVFVIKFGINLFKKENIQISNLINFIYYSYYAFNNLSNLIYLKNNFFEAIHSCEKIFNIINFEKIKTEETKEKIEIKGNIQLINITFKYPFKDAIILNDINLNIKNGEVVGIIGKSGSGKSTIANLIMRLYELNNQNSKILIDNINIKNINLKLYHKKISYVPQEPFLINGTILDNIIYGLDNINISQINEIIEKFELDFINDKKIFPQGLNTLVGDKGIQLSGGQKQRIAICRALIRKPKILILDEVTSALDPDNEYIIFKEIFENKKNMTIIIISHRLSSVKNCDNIIVLDNGKIIEMGKHIDLIKKDGMYKKMYSKQINMFND